MFNFDVYLNYSYELSSIHYFLKVDSNAVKFGRHSLEINLVYSGLVIFTGQLTLQRALDNILHSANSQSNSLKELSHSYESSESSENTLASSVLDNESVASGSDSKLSSLFNSTDDQYICKICMDERVNVVFIPCGHIATCLDCAKPLRKCPMCRAIVRGKISTEV